MSLCAIKTYTRLSPFLGTIKSRVLLNRPGSTKKTYHIVLDVKGFCDSFKPGDAIGIYPQNPGHEIDEILERLGASGEEIVLGKREKEPSSLRHFLTYRANIDQLPKALDSEGLDLPLLDYLRVRSLIATPQEIASHLGPMLPRFYSVASSPRLHPDEVHLTVATFSKQVGNREVPGLGSYFLSEGADLQETPIPLFVQSNETFVLPQDPATPIIMIGPGTGVAPFRAFMQERSLHPHSENWLFFGERQMAYDYYYRDEFEALASDARLKVSTAFSRDQEHKIYVHHKLLEHKETLLDWINRGAILYICGDAKKMARDALATLDQILDNYPESTKTLRKQKRLLLDVY